MNIQFSTLSQDYNLQIGFSGKGRLEKITYFRSGSHGNLDDIIHVPDSRVIIFGRDTAIVLAQMLGNMGRPSFNKLIQDNHLSPNTYTSLRAFAKQLSMSETMLTI